MINPVDLTVLILLYSRVQHLQHLRDIHNVFLLLLGLSSKQYIRHLGIILFGSGMLKQGKKHGIWYAQYIYRLQIF